MNMTAAELLAEMANAPRKTRSTGPKEPKEDAVPMQSFVANCPEGQVIANRRAVDRPAYKVVIVGYETDSRELGVFHWTSTDSPARLKSVVLNILRLSEERGAKLNGEDLHILAVEPVDEVPEDALSGTRDRHFIPRLPKLSLEERLAAVKEALEGEEDEAKREKMETKIAKLEAKISEASRITEEPAADETFKTKKAAEATARERGLTIENVIKNDDGKWVIENR